VLFHRMVSRETCKKSGWWPGISFETLDRRFIDGEDGVVLLSRPVF
jgi:hypothetical protein